MRLCACLGIGLDIIEPCGFLWNDKKIDRTAMDYRDAADLNRYISWDKFHKHIKSGTKNRLILMSTKSAIPYTDFEFQDGDILIAGRESAGVPDDVHEQADARVVIPMHNNMRSLNVINASAMILGEALRQTA